MGQSNVLVTYILVQQVLDYWDFNYWDDITYLYHKFGHIMP